MTAKATVALCMQIAHTMQAPYIPQGSHTQCLVIRIRSLFCAVITEVHKLAALVDVGAKGAK